MLIIRVLACNLLRPFDEIFKSPLSPNGEYLNCDMHIVIGDNVKIALPERQNMQNTFEGYDVFDALVNLRLEFEKHGYRLLCNASRVNAYPSRMSRQMSSGNALYIFKKGEPASGDDLVDALDPAPIDKIATMAEQRKAFNDWLQE